MSLPIVYCSGLFVLVQSRSRGKCTWYRWFLLHLCIVAERIINAHAEVAVAFGCESASF